MESAKTPFERLLHVLFWWAMVFAGCWIVFGTGVYMAAAWAVLCFICCHVRVRRFWPVLFGAAFLARLAAVFVLRPEPVSDFAVLLETSQGFAAGDMGFQELVYFQNWPGQTGQVIFQGLVLRLCGSIVPIKLINCLAGAGTAVLVYDLARRFFAEVPARAAGAFYAFSMAPLTMPTVLSNQPLGTFLLWLSLWLMATPLPQAAAGEGHGGYRGYRAYLSYPAAGLCLAFANAIRPDALTALVAVAAFCLFGAVSQPSPRQLKGYALVFLLFFGSYQLSFRLMSWAVAALEINSAGLAGGDFLLKLLFGLSVESRGRYSNDILAALEELQSQGMSYQEAQKHLLSQELRTTPGQLLQLFEDKEATLWLGYSMGFVFAPWQESRAGLVHLAEKGEYFCSLCSLLLGIAGFLYSRRCKKACLECLLPAFLIFANFAAYLLIEVQPRYVYGVQPALYILAAGGLEFIGKSLHMQAFEEDIHEFLPTGL